MTTTKRKFNRYADNRIWLPYHAEVNHKTREYFYVNRDYNRIGLSNQKMDEMGRSSWDEWPNKGNYSDWKGSYFYDDGTAPRTEKSQLNLQADIRKWEKKYEVYRNISF